LNTHPINDDEKDIADLETLTATHTAQLANTSASGLKTNIDNNTSNISTNTTNIGTHETEINALQTLTNTHENEITTLQGQYVPFSDFAINKSTDFLNLTTSFQDADWNDNLNTIVGSGISYSGGKWSITTNGYYLINVSLLFIANQGDEPLVSAIFTGEGTGIGSGTQLSAVSHLKKIDNDPYSYQQLTFNAILYLTTSADPFKIQVKSGGDGTGSLSTSSYFSIARIR
jgi:hypothetical protein